MDGKHSFEYVSETDRGVTFSCTECGTEVEFVKPGTGEPNPVRDGSTWKTPEDPERWTGPCDG